MGLRKLTSAGSAASSVCDHIREWYLGTQPNCYASMGVMSDGSYGIPKGIVFSFPV
jgi:malate dehydrogenase